ncbi:hypothetical protein ACFY19_22560 [Streptosporangium saharense]|uniref:FXSXX-COOH protein n=1 Tax=Streptosporangium saharense TaxID=1706840 RepID=A0A7W7QN89_9ACTN|nr:hypothetical protein [Streptosporangium saharense]MBB4916685.1 hypothetical protein [Streptosporangium saharense]
MREEETGRVALVDVHDLSLDELGKIGEERLRRIIEPLLENTHDPSSGFQSWI